MDCQPQVSIRYHSSLPPEKDEKRKFNGISACDYTATEKVRVRVCVGGGGGSSFNHFSLLIWLLSPAMYCVV